MQCLHPSNWCRRGIVEPAANPLFVAQPSQILLGYCHTAIKSYMYSVSLPKAMLRVALGVDGGGTKTACVVMDLDTRAVRGQGVAGSSNKNRYGALPLATQHRPALLSRRARRSLACPARRITLFTTYCIAQRGRGERTPQPGRERPIGAARRGSGGGACAAGGVRRLRGARWGGSSARHRPGARLDRRAVPRRGRDRLQRCHGCVAVPT